MNELSVINSSETEEKQYIVFLINKEYFGIDIDHINSIIQMPKISMVPNGPEYLLGMTSVRDRVIPIVSLHKKMNYGEENITSESRVIILNLENDEIIGIVVDEVREVTKISSDDIQEASPFVSKEDSFISGVGKKEDNLISIFEVATLIA